MEPIDICYTPLDLPEPPNVDMKKLFEWMEYSRNYIHCDLGKYAQESLGEDYPWIPAFPYHRRYGGWTCDFKNEFANLADYMTYGYGIEPTDLASISFIPIKEGKIGLGFWHTDSDLYGLRLYLQNENYNENPLLYRKTVNPVIERYKVKNPMDDDDPRFEKTTHICKLLLERQPFYINNIRGVHSPYINKPSKRFAVLISGGVGETKVFEKTKSLIINSAKKFHEHCILF